MKEVLLTYLQQLPVSHEIQTVLAGMLPILELRGAIPYAYLVLDMGQHRAQFVSSLNFSFNSADIFVLGNHSDVIINDIRSFRYHIVEIIDAVFSDEIIWVTTRW